MGVVVRCDPREDQQEASLSLGLPVISLSIHPPDNTRCLHNTLQDTQICVVVNIYTVHTNICVYPPPDIVLSKRPKPSMVAVSCDVVCVLLSSLFTIGWNASNLSTAHREDTPDTLLVKLSQYFPVSSAVSSYLIFIYLSTRNKKHLRYLLH